MASRILIEDDIVDQGGNEIDQLKSNEETMVKEEDPEDVDIDSSNESQDSDMDTTEIFTKQYSFLLANVIVLGSKEKKKQDGNTSQDESKRSPDEGTTSQDEGNSSPDEGTTSQDEGNSSPDEGTTTQDEGNSSPDEGTTSQDEAKSSPDEGTTSHDDGNTCHDEGNTSPDKVNISQDGAIESTVTPVRQGEKGDEDFHREYDVFGDENKIFKKYKLRKIEQIVSYKEPPDVKLKRPYSVDNETNLTCPNCKQVLENKVAFLNHLRIHNKRDLAYTCSICSMKF